MSAYKDLMEYLREGEVVEGIVFGDYGWGGYKEKDEFRIPADKRGVVLTLEEAEPYMQGWSFDGGYGAPSCYATYVWTNKSVIWVWEYDGSTGLTSAPRNPEPCRPQTSGG